MRESRVTALGSARLELRGGTCKTRADFPAPSQAAWGPLALLASVEVQAAEQESQTLLVQVVKVKNCDL